MKGFSAGVDPIDLLKEREAILTLLPQTSPGMLQRDISKYTIDPRTRYKNVGGLMPLGDVTYLYDTDNGLNVTENPIETPDDVIKIESGMQYTCDIAISHT